MTFLESEKKENKEKGEIRLKRTNIIDKLMTLHKLEKEEYIALLQCNQEEKELLRSEAVRLRKEQYGNKVYTRGLIEFTNICKNNCYYCGIRAANPHVNRYRLSKEDIMACCKQGYGLGYRTFVLQGGEDPYFTDDIMCDIVSSIRKEYPDCAITLSIGERSYESYKRLREAGADRYLLRHETATSRHYEMLHPETMQLSNRMQCLKDLKDLGYQVGAGFMVGSPYQTQEHLANDLVFLQEFRPHMVGIGPFIPHHDTPFHDCDQGSLEETLLLLSIIRIMLPSVLLPATTALGTVNPRGRELGLQAGCNVVMPNLSPVGVRKQYELYDNKICTGEEAAECLGCLSKRVNSVGCELVSNRGDYHNLQL